MKLTEAGEVATCVIDGSDNDLLPLVVAKRRSVSGLFKLISPLAFSGGAAFSASCIKLFASDENAPGDVG